MLHYWKSGKQKIAYDTASGAIVPLTSLEYKMIQAITPPLAPLCPSSLRYELAKYDSADVEEAYTRIYDLFSHGVIFSDAAVSRPRIRIGGEFGLKNTDDPAKEIIQLLDGQTPEWIIETGTDEEIVAHILSLC